MNGRNRKWSDENAVDEIRTRIASYNVHEGELSEVERVRECRMIDFKLMKTMDGSEALEDKPRLKEIFECDDVAWYLLGFCDRILARTHAGNADRWVAPFLRALALQGRRVDAREFSARLSAFAEIAERCNEVQRERICSAFGRIVADTDAEVSLVFKTWYQRICLGSGR